MKQAAVYMASNSSDVNLLKNVYFNPENTVENIGCSAHRLIEHCLTRVIKTQITIEASITLYGVTLTDPLIR
jgi:hypothetical protein